MPNRILIVDPEELPRMELSIQLQEMGYQVEVAQDGREALEIFGIVHPQLVITDLLLGQLSGFEISTRIAADSAHSCPVIFYSAFYRSESARREIIEKYSAKGYFIKPFQLPQLRKAVAEIMSALEGRPPEVQEGSKTGEVQEEPAQLVIPTSTESRQGPVIPATDPAPVAPVLETEAAVKDVTQEAQRSFDLMIKELLSVEPAAGPMALPTKEPGSVDAILTQMASLTQAGKQADTSADSIARQPPPVPSKDKAAEPSADEPPPPVLTFAVSSSRRPLLLGILLGLVSLVIGLYLVSRLYWEISHPPLTETQGPSSQQPSSPLHTERSAGRTPPGEQPWSKAQTVRPAEPVSNAQAEQQPPGTPRQTSNPYRDELFPAGRQSPPAVRTDLGGTQSRSSAVLPIKVNEVSGESGPPHLRQTPPLVIPAQAARTATKPLVIRLEISSAGNIVGSRVVNESPENAVLVPIVKASLSDWKFTPTELGSRRTLMKYFSFKVNQ